MAVFNIIGCGGFTAEVLHEVEQIYADKILSFYFLMTLKHLMNIVDVILALNLLTMHERIFQQ